MREKNYLAEQVPLFRELIEGRALCSWHAINRTIFFSVLFACGPTRAVQGVYGRFDGNNNMNNRHVVLFIAILVLGSLLRFFNYDIQPLKVDEAYTHWFASRDWVYLWGIVPLIEIHPVLYYSIVKVWLVFGWNEAMLRLPSVLISIFTLPLVFYAGRMIGGSQQGVRTGLLAMLICAFGTIHIERAQEARSYAFWLFSMAVSVAALAWLVRNPKIACLPIRNWIRTPSAVKGFSCLSLGLSLLMWFHNAGVAYVASIALFCVVWWIFYVRMSRWAFLNLLLCAAVAFLLYSPNLGNVLFQSGTVSGRELFPPNAPSLTTFLYETANAVGVWYYAPLRNRYLLGLNMVLILVAAGGMLALAKRDRGAFAVMLLILTVFPVALLLWITSTINPVLFTRILGPISVPFYLLLASSGLLFGKDWKMPVAIGACVVGIYAISLPVFYMAPLLKEPWDRIVRLMERESKGSGVVIVVPNEAGLALDYYDRKLASNLEFVSLPGDYPFRGFPPVKTPLGNGSAEMDRYAIEVLERSVAKQVPEWLLQRAALWYDPKGMVQHYLEQRFCVTRYDIGTHEYIEIFKLSKLDPISAESCGTRVVRQAQICPGLLTAIARSPIGCIGNAPGVSRCDRIRIKCRLDDP